MINIVLQIKELEKSSHRFWALSIQKSNSGEYTDILDMVSCETAEPGDLFAEIRFPINSCNANQNQGVHLTILPSCPADISLTDIEAKVLRKIIAVIDKLEALEIYDVSPEYLFLDGNEEMLPALSSIERVDYYICVDDDNPSNPEYKRIEPDECSDAQDTKALNLLIKTAKQNYVNKHAELFEENRKTFRERIKDYIQTQAVQPPSPKSRSVLGSGSLFKPSSDKYKLWQEYGDKWLSLLANNEKSFEEVMQVIVDDLTAYPKGWVYGHNQDKSLHQDGIKALLLGELGAMSEECKYSDSTENKKRVYVDGLVTNDSCTAIVTQWCDRVGGKMCNISIENDIVASVRKCIYSIKY